MKTTKSINFFTMILLAIFVTISCPSHAKKESIVAESGGSGSGTALAITQEAVPATGRSETSAAVLSASTTVPAVSSPIIPAVSCIEIPVAEFEKEQAAEPLKKQSQERHIPANMVLIPGGSFQMGDNSGDRDESPAHPVTVGSFYMGKYEVTQQEFAAVMGNNPSGFKGDVLPVENVNWFDAVEYCNRLSAKEGLSPAYRGEGVGITCDFAVPGYRLPTEAEWEYAARGRQETQFAGADDADTAGWYNANSNGMTREAGAKTTNGFGLYDMSGNVWEWCWDWYGNYTDGGQTSPSGNAAGTVRVARGGGWGNSAWNLRVSARSSYGPSTRNSSVGFRVVRAVF